MDDQEIARRLEKYDQALHKGESLLLPLEEEIVKEQIDPLVYISQFIDTLKSVDRDVCLCQEGEDLFCTIISVESHDNSNCVYCIDIECDSDIKIPKSADIEIFSLSKDDEETAIATIRKTLVKSKKRSIVSEIDIEIVSPEFPCSVRMTVDVEHFVTKKRTLSLKLDYMNYSVM